MTASTVRFMVGLVGMFLLVPQHNQVLACMNQTSQAEQRAVYVTGHVAHPGTYPFEELMTVETLVQRAGGFVGQEPHRILVLRVIDGQATALVTTLYTSLRAGDTLVVSQPRSRQNY